VAYCEDALLSVKWQSYAEMEHIFMDGGSTDGTVEKLRKYAAQAGWEHLRLISEADRGQSDALNKGFDLATGDIIGWLNSDDRYRPGCFEAVVDAFNSNPSVDIIYGDYTWIDEHHKLLQIRREIEFSHFILLCHRVLYIPSTATFFRRRIFDEGNLIDLEFHYAMDHEFFARLARQGYRFKHIPKLMADFRWHPDSKSSKNAAKQVQEVDKVASIYSPVLNKFPDGIARSLALMVLRRLAAGLRYSEKLFRGYYLDQFFSRSQKVGEADRERETQFNQISNDC